MKTWMLSTKYTRPLFVKTGVAWIKIRINPALNFWIKLWAKYVQNKIEIIPE